MRDEARTAQSDVGRTPRRRYFFFRDRRRLLVLRLLLLEREGTFPPSRRASDSPMAMACLRLVTLRPELPLRSVPSLRSCIARFTFV
jgi:hypothetical protein